MPSRSAPSLRRRRIRIGCRQADSPLRATQRSRAVVSLMRHRNDRVDAAPNVKVGDELHDAWSTRRDEVIHDSVGHGLVKVTFISEGPEVEFQRLQLYAQSVRDVGQ